ncbi:MAG: Hsp70 family protein, partial [Acidobacteria bacterium]|nr:Hsp70 family protein [Acidobacteriota bacterium]
ELELGPKAKGRFHLRLGPDPLPADFRERKLEYRLIVNDDERMVRALEVEVKAGPRPKAQPVSFGQMAEKTVETRFLELINEGGIRCKLESVTVQGSAHFGVGALDLPVFLEPGGRLKVPLTCDSGQEGPLPSADSGFLLHFSNAESLFVPAKAHFFRYRLAPKPEKLHWDGSERSEFRHSLVLENQGTIDVEITSLRTEESWIVIPDFSEAVVLKAPSDGNEAGTSSLSLEIRANPSELGQGLHRGRLLIETKGDLPSLEIPVELRLRPIEEYREYVGIDFGTTNSVVAFWDQDDDQVRVVEIGTSLGGSPSPLIPSLLDNTDKQGSYRIGPEAALEEFSRPEWTVRSVKRIMGYDKDWDGPDRPYSPEELASLILRFLVQVAEKKLTERSGIHYQVSQAIVTVPASFFDLQCQAILKACEMAGLEVEEVEAPDRKVDEDLEEEYQESNVLDEPSAAALYLLYHLREEGGLEDELDQLMDRDEGLHLLVFDYGGGTLDISVARLSTLEDGGLELRILATCGNDRLGGDHLDIVLMRDFFADARAKYSAFDESLIRANYQKLQRRREEEGWPEDTWNKVIAARGAWKQAAESLKIELSARDLKEDEETSVSLPASALGQLEGGVFVHAKDDLPLILSRQRLEERLSPSLKDSRPLLEQALTL